MPIFEWKLRKDGEAIAQVLSFVKAPDQTKIVSELNDGSYQIQTVGSARHYANVTVFCASREEMDAVNEAEADVDVLTLNYRDEEYTGVIRAAPRWDATVPGERYTGTFVLLLES